MARMSECDFAAMVEDGAESAEILELRDESDRRLVGVMLADRLSDGFSAVYSFFDPADRKRSIGTYMIMRLVEETCRRGLQHVYLGYWIAGSRKMAYKARFQPLELLDDGVWRDLTDEEKAAATVSGWTAQT